MKIQRKNGCMGIENLAASIAAGRLRPEQSEPFIYGTYLEVWWRSLKLSRGFKQSCRTGIFTSHEAYKTFMLFGQLENLSIQEWWLKRGHHYFSESITTLQVTLYIKRRHTRTYEITVDAAQDIPSQLVGKEFGFWLDQINLLNANGGLLSLAPLCWPIFQSRITCEVIAQLLNLLEIHEEIIRNSPKTPLWKIGEQLKLKPRAMPKPSDCYKDIVDKNKAMGQTVSGYLSKSRKLVENASKGIFPKFDP